MSLGKKRLISSKSGASMIELLIYVSLLGLLAAVVFGFVWQIQRKNKTVLGVHTSLHVTQMAAELLSRDLRASTKLGREQHKLLCQSSQGLVTWYLNKGGALWRVEQNSKTKKAVPAKVLDKLVRFEVKPLKLKNGAVLVTLKLIDQQQQVIKKKLLLRASLTL